MMIKKKFVVIILVLLLIAIFIVLYFKQTDWVNMQGWQGQYDEDTIYLNGLEGLEIDCSVDVQIQYSYYVESGEIELKITSDSQGEQVIKKISITESCEGTITFENPKAEKGYIFETAEKGSVANGEGLIQERLSKWEQYLMSKEAQKEYYELQSQQ